MKITDYLKITEFLNDCPKCKYGMLGTNKETGEFNGSLNVNDNLFTRKCKCGFQVIIDSKLGTNKKTIEKQIEQALKF